MTLLTLVCLIILLIALPYLRAPLWLAAGVLLALSAAAIVLDAAWWAVALYLLFALPLVFLSIRPLRRPLVSNRIFNWFRGVLPSMSTTEQQALEAGSVWWDAELFSGRPRWRRLLRTPRPGLSAEEQAFLDGPVETLCDMLDEWKINHVYRDLPPEVWAFLKEQRFFSMIIPREFGGLGFSAQANAAVIIKISSRSQVAAVTVMVPNSLGPGELLMHFGTDEQKSRYLPRLASGEDIPCFALTSPLAGSDAASMPDRGIVCKGEYQGQEVLGLRVTWDKRYITLAPVATLLGLAFKTDDPDGLLGDRKELGITCALVPTDTPGVEIGERHLPSGTPFMNGPTRGKDVFIPMDWVIGGRQRIGQGWPMLMHCLSAGRAISLPAQGIANGKVACLFAGAYARVRQQFKQPIGNFEGVEEPLARIAGETYRMDAAQRLTLVALDQGEKPVVLSAILKYNLTDSARRLMNDAMDIHGGKTVIDGPRNYLSAPYHAIPIAITVEGANILTRSMIVFGQGAIRCHPWLLKEMKAARSDDAEGRKAFDQAFWGHAGYLLSNLVRTPLLAKTGPLLNRSPVSGPTAWAYRRVNHLCAAFTLIADVSLLMLGGKFKFREKLSGRLADALSHLYMACAVLKRFEDDGRPEEDLPLVEWAVRDSFHRVESALYGVLANFPSRPVGLLLHMLAFPFGRTHPAPDDRLGSRVARILLSDNPARDRLIQGAFRCRSDDAAATLTRAFEAVQAAADADQAIRNALKAVPDPDNVDELVAKAMDAGVIDSEQAERVRRAQQLTAEVIAVDSFPPEAFDSEPTSPVFENKND